MQVRKLFHHEDARLSEGVNYSPDSDILYWIDIYKASIHRLSHPFLSQGEQQYDYFTISKDNYDPNIFNVEYPVVPADEGQFHESVGVVFLCENGNENVIYFGSKFGIGQLNFQTGKWCYVILYNQCPELANDNRWVKLRSNDGNVSPDGKFIFIGLMNDFNFEPTDFKKGCILKISLVEKTIELVWDSIKIPNAIQWNLNNDKIYITDSLNHCIWECGYDHHTNSIDLHSKRSIINTKEHNPEFESPEPDGSDIDKINNHLYVSVWSTHSVQVYDLLTGNLIEKIQLPDTVPRVSCNFIVGDKLFVTTANMNIDNESNVNAQVKDNEGGSIYIVDGAVVQTNPNQHVPKSRIGIKD